MNFVAHIKQVIQVVKVRNHGYATANMINRDGSIIKRDQTLVVKFPVDAQGAVQAGSLWEVSGKERASSYIINDYNRTEYTLFATEVKFLKPSGRVLSRWISSNIPDIGHAIADRLVRTDGLVDAINNRDHNKLLSVKGMTPNRVNNLLANWPDNHLYEVIDWLESQSLPLGLGSKLIDIFGCDALDKVKTNPFLLMAMGASFEKTMSVAEALGLSLADEAVLAGVAQHFAVSHSFRTGSTVVDQQSLVDGCTEIVGREIPENIGEIAVKYGFLVNAGSGYQVYGTAVQEVSVAMFLTDCLNRKPGAHALLAAWEKFLTEDSIDETLLEYEKNLDFQLTTEQRLAIKGAVMSPVCGISGGAGTGKTTILKGIIQVYEALSGNLPVYQVALSGRAAQRMSESTGRPAQSIAKFIFRHIGKGKEELPPHLLLIIDESSMVDLLSMYKLVGILPPATRIIFVGDTEQLPPVGAGLVFHTLSETNIPFYNLSQVKRQGNESGIHRFAISIRNGSVVRPELMNDTVTASSDCVIEEDARIERLVTIWDEARSNNETIVLSPVRKGSLGVVAINKKLQAHVGTDRPPLSYIDESRGWIPWCSQDGEFFHEDDPILITKNNYDEDADLRNGDLGVITEVFDEPDEDGFVGTLLVNDQYIGITSDLLHKMSLGYAVTVHKAQGSQWNTTIIAMSDEGLSFIDKTLVYTAATRATKKLIMIGNFSHVEGATRRGSIALKRITYMKERLKQVQL